MMAVGTERLSEMFELMATLREFDSHLEDEVYFHSAYGEEAVQIGTFYGLRDTDVIAPAYRGAEIVYFMRGESLRSVYASFLGRKESWSHGHAAGHTGNPALNVVTWINGIIGPHLTLATGRALALQMERRDDVVVCSFGDGTMNTPSFGAAMNFSALWKLPIVFVCQNNNFQISASVESVNGNTSFAERALGYGVPGSEVDGNDVELVHEAVTAAVARARAGGGPSFIDAKTYRIHGHIELDLAEYRPAVEVDRWRDRDPLELVANRLREAGLADAVAEALDRARNECATAWKEALDAPAAGVMDAQPHMVFASAD